MLENAASNYKWKDSWILSINQTLCIYYSIT